MNLQERRILAVTCVGHFLSHFNMLVFPAIVLPLASRLHLDLAVVLGLSFWQYLLFGVTALPWGMVADRFGAKRLLLLYFFGAGLSGLAAAVFIDTPWAFSLCLAGVGLFSGIYHPAGLGMISKGIRRVSAGMGYNGMFGNLGLATAPLLTGLVTWIWSPRGAYIVLAGANLIGFLLMLIMKVEEPEEKHTEYVGQNERTLGPFLILLAAMMMGGIAYRGATVILPTYFELKGEGIYQMLAGLTSSGLSANVVATSLTSLIYLIGMIGQFTGGFVGERYEARWSYVVFHLITLPPVFLMAWATNLPLVLLSVVYFFFLLGMQPIENTLVARLTPPRFHHSAFGAKFILTFGVGAVAVKAIGWVEKGWGIEAVFPSLGMVSVCLILIALLLIRVTSPVRPSGGS